MVADDLLPYVRVIERKSYFHQIFYGMWILLIHIFDEANYIELHQSKMDCDLIDHRMGLAAQSWLCLPKNEV